VSTGGGATFPPHGSAVSGVRWTFEKSRTTGRLAAAAPSAGSSPLPAFLHSLDIVSERARKAKKSKSTQTNPKKKQLIKYTMKKNPVFFCIIFF